MEVIGAHQLVVYPISPKCLLLCSAERHYYRFGTTWVCNWQI